MSPWARLGRVVFANVVSVFLDAYSSASGVVGFIHVVHTNTYNIGKIIMLLEYTNNASGFKNTGCKSKKQVFVK